MLESELEEEVSEARAAQLMQAKISEVSFSLRELGQLHN